MHECPDCGALLYGQAHCQHCGWTLAPKEQEPARPERQEFYIEKPERPSTVEDARVALHEVLALLDRIPVVITDLTARRAELQRQAKQLDALT